MMERASGREKQTWFDRDAAGNLVHEFRDYSGYLGEDSHLYYYYDANGSIGSISYNGVRYAFRKNLQGDVIAILDTSGNVVARYTYDAWGRILSITDGNGNANTSSTFIGNVNPIRYRGYYYDTETGWYYLNSRYYDPQVKRFINADGIIGANGPLTGVNLFAYCNNNPVRYDDQIGAYINDTTHVSHRIPGGSYGIEGNKYEAGFNANEYTPFTSNNSVVYAISLGSMTVSLKNGYTARIDNPHVDGDQKHIHIMKDKTEVANQNEDGTPHHKNKNKPNEPSNKIKRQIRELTNWDWDANANKQNIVELPTGKEFYEQYSFFVTPAPGPMPNVVLSPSPGYLPAPVVVIP